MNMKIAALILIFLIFINITFAEDIIINFNLPKPEIINSSIKISQNNNQPVVFCNAITNPDSWVMYKWYVNDELLVNENEPTLNLGNVKVNDVVKCEAIATNSYENVSKNVSLKISDKNPNPITGYVVRNVENNPRTSIFLILGIIFLVILIFLNVYYFYRMEK